MELSYEELMDIMTKGLSVDAKAITPPYSIKKFGKAICVLDKGFVYIGSLSIDDKFAIIECAQCIREWGTKKGLGQLAIEGPQSGTILDETGTIVLLKEELKHAMLTEESLWN